MLPLSISLLFFLITNISCKVCIVGGGFAGLSAAAELSNKNIDFLLLEASNRLGGRVYPIEYEGSTLQLGAEYINGKDNEIYRIANKLGLIAGLENDYGMYDDNSTYVAGKLNIDKKDIDLFQQFVEPLERKFEKLAENEKMAGKSVGEVFRAEYEQWIQDHLPKKRLFDGLSRVYETYYEAEWSSPIDELALSNLAEFDDGSDYSNSYYLKNGGFKGILNELISRVPKQKIRMNSEVRHIDWQKSPVELILMNGTMIKCDRVIVTIPLGVLKGQTDLFRPALPSYKRQVIETLGFGSLEKIFLQYSQLWWKSQATIITIPGFSEHPDSFRQALRTFETVEGQPHLLRVWLSGDAPLLSMFKSNVELGREITIHLREMLSNNQIPEPDDVIRHNWKGDRLIRGAYSYITPSSYQSLDDSFVDMMKSVNWNGRPVIHFAGENCHASMYQTTVGAWESGKREAARIVSEMLDK